MPIAKANPATPSTEVKTPIKITPPEYRGVVVDTRYDPRSSLLTYVAGRSWTVTYYSQVLGKDNDPKAQDVSLSPIYQPYIKIIDMDVKVTSPLTSSQNSETKKTSFTGVGTLFPGVTPNDGDMFVADVGDGREAVFQVTNTERKSLMQDAVFSIEYSFIYFSDQDLTRRQDLDNKAVKTNQFVKDFLLNGQNPMVVAEDFTNLKSLDRLRVELINSYFSWFLSKEYRTLILPGQPTTIYDSFLVGAIKALLTPRDHQSVRDMRFLNTDEDDYLNQPQLWSALMDRNPGLLVTANKEMGIAPTAAFFNDPMMNGIRYSGINSIVYPKNPDTSLGYSDVPKKLLIGGLVVVPSRPASIADLVSDTQLDGDTGIPTIHSVLKDSNYVLSEAFYKDTNGKSLLEVLTRQYLDRKAIDPAALVKVCSDYKNWGGLERFYYIPILLILITAIIRDM